MHLWQLRQNALLRLLKPEPENQGIVFTIDDKEDGGIREMEKPYIVTLTFGTTQRQIWFSGEDTEEYEEKYREAMQGITEIGDSCSVASEFYSKVIAHFESYGFKLAAK